MHLNNLPYFVQPPLYFWLAAAFSLHRRHAVRAAPAVGAGNDRACGAHRLHRRPSSGDARGRLCGRRAVHLFDAGRDRTAGDHGRAARLDRRADDLRMVPRARDRTRPLCGVRLARRGRRFPGEGPRGTGRRAPRDRAVLRLEPALRDDARALRAGVDCERRCVRRSRRTVDDRTRRTRPLLSLPETDRRVHDRPVHGRRRESGRAGVVLRARHHPRLLPVDRVLADGDRLRRSEAAPGAFRRIPGSRGSCASASFGS